MNLLLPAAAALGVWYFARGAKRTSEHLAIDIISGGFTNISTKQITGSIEVQAINPEPMKVAVKTVYYVISFAGNDVGYVQNFQQFEIPARSQSTFKVTFGIPLLTILSKIPDVVSKIRAGGLTAKCTGFVDTSVGRINQEKELSFKL